ncbi:MAG: hypothetical protein OEW15_08380 [Nitrospirota bacterium]|nr:hypothetical protein [Nitrospirota bacterium]
MKLISLMMRIWCFAGASTIFMLSGTTSVHAAAFMSDYCIKPPLIGAAIKPNLLMLIDNSASMYDLNYTDLGTFGTCATSKKYCKDNTECDTETGEVCQNIVTRTTNYCYDQTFSSKNTYFGYFDETKFYEYYTDVEPVKDYFYEIASLPAAGCTYGIPNQLCIMYDPATKFFSHFSASGNYLNWLSASKFDGQKKVLTGGKYNPTDQWLLAESRGCVGRKFVKEALTADYSNNLTAVNTSLGITFGINGPVDKNNPTAPSSGGLTSIDIFLGNYNESVCQSVVDAYSSNNLGDIKNALKACLGTVTTTTGHCSSKPDMICTTDADCTVNLGTCVTSGSGKTAVKQCSSPLTYYTCSLNITKACSLAEPCGATEGTCTYLISAPQSCTNDNACASYNVGPCAVTMDPSVESKQKAIFNQSIQACWAYTSGTKISQDDVIAVKNFCTDIYAGMPTKVCTSGAKVGQDCLVNVDCGTSGELCEKGPSAILPGNPAYLCNTNYAGLCAKTTTGWETTIWWDALGVGADNTVNPNLSADENCIQDQHVKFCEETTAPPVVDPSNSTSDTTQFGNLPAIVGDISVQVQLGKPIKTMKVQVKTAEEPKGLIQSYDDIIRMGAMTFSVNGSPTECTTTVPTPSGQIPCPRKCSTSPDPAKPIYCSTKYDCPLTASGGYGTCDLLASGTENRDGAKVIHYVGYGTCNVKTTTICDSDAECTAAGHAKCYNNVCVNPNTTKCATSYHCLANEVCITDGAGDHSAGLIKSIDDVNATSWTPFAEAFYNAIGYFAKANPDPVTGAGANSRTDLRLNIDDFRGDLNPSEYPCQRNALLLLTDGMSTADMNSSVNGLVNTYFSPSATIGVCADTATEQFYSGSQNLDDLSYLANKYDITSFALGSKSSPAPTGISRYKKINTFVAFTGSSNNGTGDCNSETLLSKTATNGGSTMAKATNPVKLQQELQVFFDSISADTVSGTAASVLASGEGSGANLVQAVFYPVKEFENPSKPTNPYRVSWMGRLSNMWYYVDPLFSNSNIREDESDKVLYLKTDGSHHDYITQFFFDEAKQAAMLRRYNDSNGDGSIVNEGQPTPATDKVEKVMNLWEAGTRLLSQTTRTVWTTTNGTSLTPFNTGAKTSLRKYLQTTTDNYSYAIIDWTLGNDKPTVTLSNGQPYTYTSFRRRTASVLDGGVLQTGTWKLGDVLNSTPRIASWQPLNDYHLVYNGSPPGYIENTYGPPGLRPLQSEPVSSKYYVTKYNYKGRGMVYVGSNDGMLHAFRLGLLQLKWPLQDTKYEMAKLTNSVCSGNYSYVLCSDDAHCPGGETCKKTVKLGEEAWAFIPKNMLPYLRYMMDPNYCHVYGVDLTPVIFDASTVGCAASSDYSFCFKNSNSWKTFLIGGMRLGGACRAPSDTCSNCVKTPMVDPDDATATKGLGYSSYFALDITNQDVPVLKWEFDGTDPAAANMNKLGFSTSGPAVVRISTKTAGGTQTPLLNGKWFVVFGSGPTGPIDKGSAQYLAKSDQQLRLAIFDLELGPSSGITWKGESSATGDLLIPNAFVGSLLNGTHDVDLDYSDDVVYVPYVYKQFSTGEYNIGGLVRLVTHENTNPSNWDLSYVMRGTGPLTSAIAKLTDKNNNLWLYFGSGRYFFDKGGEADDADPPNGRQLFALKERCLIADKSGFKTTCGTNDSTLFCGDPIGTTACGTPSGLINVTTDVNAAEDLKNATPPTDYPGWYINMDKAGSYTDSTTGETKEYRGERSITDPFASSTGIVYFTSFRPYNDACQMGGKTHLWAMKYDTGASPIGLLKGKAIIQVSTGSIEQIDLSAAFVESGGRKSAGITGVPPSAQGLSIMASPRAARKVVHIKER